MARLSALVLAALVLWPTSTATITLTPGTPLQVMRGWEVTHSGMFLANFSTWKDNLTQAGVDYGLNRVRLEVRSGAENTTDYYAAWIAAGHPGGGDSGPGDAWRAHRYETINDNSDPNDANLSGHFYWTEMDDMIDNFVTPMRAMMAARGEQLYVNLCLVSFTSQITTGAPYVLNDPDEYAEFMSVAFAHLQSKYGWTPDGIEMILEPDFSNTEWPPDKIGDAINATGARLAAEGFHPDFIAPSTSFLSVWGSTYNPGLVAVPGVLTYLKEMSFHRYGSPANSDISAVWTTAGANGLTTSMLEYWDGPPTHLTLLDDLSLAHVSAWQGKTLSGLFDVDTGTGAVTATAETELLKHYWLHVRMGAQRITSSSSNGALTPEAWINTGGNYTVVVSAASAQSFTIGNLPDGTYHIRYSTASVTDVDPGDATVSGGSDLSTSIPAAGVLVVYKDAPVSSTTRLPIRIGRGQQ